MDPITLDHLAAWRLLPKESARGRVLIVHGLGEHSARHQNTTDFLLGKGFEVVRFDLRGAGRSGGRRQWVEKFEDYVDDMARVFHWILRECPPLPLFVLGHSLGGAISTHFTATYQKELTGLILSAPAHVPGEGVSAIKIKVGRWLLKVAPTLRIPGSTDHGYLSKDPGIAENYAKDPLACHFNTIQQGNEILRALSEMISVCGKIHLPVLIVHGSADRIVKLEGSFQMIRALKSADKTLHIIPGGYHEPHNDHEKQEYFTAVLQWLEKHLKPSDVRPVAASSGRHDAPRPTPPG